MMIRSFCLVLLLLASLCGLAEAAALEGGKAGVKVVRRSRSHRTGRADALAVDSAGHTQTQLRANEGGGQVVDMFFRSYARDLRFLQYSISSLARSVGSEPEGIRNVILVVPATDVPQFEAKLAEIWQQRNLPTEVRARFQVVPSKVSLKVGDPRAGYSEQMLDKMHADYYTDADVVAFFDTDAVLWRNLTKSQLIDPQTGKPHLCYRDFDRAATGKSWMKVVGDMIGPDADGQDALQHEYMCALGQAYPSKMFAHLRAQVLQQKGKRWEEFVGRALVAPHGSGESPEPWLDPEYHLPFDSSFTEFNAFGAVLWRDFHDEMHWVGPDNHGIAAPYQAWSWETDEAKMRQKAKVLECLINGSPDSINSGKEGSGEPGTFKNDVTYGCEQFAEAAMTAEAAGLSANEVEAAANAAAAPYRPAYVAAAAAAAATASSAAESAQATAPPPLASGTQA